MNDNSNELIESFSSKIENNNEKLNDFIRDDNKLSEKIISIVKPVSESVPIGRLCGHVSDVSGLTVRIEGIDKFTSVGDEVQIKKSSDVLANAEIIAFDDKQAIAMTYDSIEGIGCGCPVYYPIYDKDQKKRFSGGILNVNDSWIGRVLDPMGKPIDGKGSLIPSNSMQNRRASPPLATQRARLGDRIDLGVKAMNIFTTCKEGQRLGLFAGSGVGKSTLIGMLARNTDCDVAVISLVGERGREVREFIEDDLGEEGLKKSILVIATSDSSALMRREAAYSAMAIAEHFRDQGKSVLLLMDSVTRFCQALREIGLSSGEIPATRGYPPSVFATLPRLLERSGPGKINKDGKAGQITALFSVLIEGDDHNEPIADTVRGILDGHIIMERSIAESGRYPAINVLKSLSRSVPGCLTEEEFKIVTEARKILSTWNDVRELVRLGAYKEGADQEADKAVFFGPKIEDYLIQGKKESFSIEESFAGLLKILRGE